MKERKERNSSKGFRTLLFTLVFSILFSFPLQPRGDYGHLFDRILRLENRRQRMNFSSSLASGFPYFPDSLIKDDFLLNDDTIGGTKQFHPRVGGKETAIITFSDARDGNSDVFFQRFSLSGSRLGINTRVNDDRTLNWQGESDLCITTAGNFVFAWEDRRELGNSDVYIQIYDAQGNRIGNNIKANDDGTKTDQRDVALTTLPQGRFLVVWDDWRNDPGDIYGQVFSEEGMRIGTNFRINEGPWLQYHPSCAADSEGNFVVVWQDGRGQSWDIYARRFDKNGHPLSGDFLVNDDNTNFDQGAPEVAMKKDGSFIIVWTDGRNGNPDIYAQRFAPNGQRIGPNFLVNEISSGNQSAARIVIDPTGRFYISYLSDHEGNPNIYLVMFDQEGNRIGRSVRVSDDNPNAVLGMNDINITTDGNIWVVWEDSREGNPDVYGQILRDTMRIGQNFRVNDDYASTHQRCSFITVDNQGEFLVTWEDERNGDIDIYAQRIDSLGNLLGKNFRVDDATSVSYQFYPAAARAHTGNFLIVWTDTREGDPDIYAQFYDKLGNRLGTNFRVNHPKENTQWYPIVSSDSVGNFLVVWMDRREGSWDIYGQRYDRNQNPIGANFRINDFITGDQIYAYCAMDKKGNFVITWMDDREGNFDIYAQLFNQEGSPIGNNFKVNETSDSFQGYPACTRNQDYFVITWEDERNGNVDIYAQVFLTNGQRIGGNFRVNDDATREDQYSPTVDIDENSSIIFIWMDGRKGDGDWDIYAQRFDSTQRRIGGNCLINRPDSFPGNNQWLIGQGVRVSKNKIGFAWIDNRRHQGWDIYAKMVNLSYLAITKTSQGKREGFRLKTYYLNQIEIPSGEVVIYDVKGARIGGKGGRLKMNSLGRGIYIIELKTKDRVYQKKFIKL